MNPLEIPLRIPAFPGGGQNRSRCNTWGTLKTELMQDGQTLNQVNGGNITISNKDGKVVINNSANIVASIPASNGIIHVIDAVLLPPSK